MWADARSGWAMLAMFAGSNFANAVLWITFAPIQSKVSAFYNVNATAVNMLSLSFMILYLPSTVLISSRLLAGSGLRSTVVAGALLNVAGSCIRLASGYFASELENLFLGAPFAVLMLGQCITALAQPCFTNSPARLAGDWFPLEQRNIATTIAALINPAGEGARRSASPGTSMLDPCPPCMSRRVAVYLALWHATVHDERARTARWVSDRRSLLDTPCCKWTHVHPPLARTAMRSTRRHHKHTHTVCHTVM